MHAENFVCTNMALVEFCCFALGSKTYLGNAASLKVMAS